MDPSSGLAQIAQLGAQSLATSAEAIAAVTDLVQRSTGIDITVTSEITDDQQYVFRGIEKRPVLPVERDSAMPFSMSMCSRVHAGESPATVPDTREVPALARASTFAENDLTFAASTLGETGLIT